MQWRRHDDDAFRAVIDREVGGQSKVRSFYSNIYFPDDPRTPITDLYRVVVDTPWTPWDALRADRSIEVEWRAPFTAVNGGTHD